MVRTCIALFLLAAIPSFGGSIWIETGDAGDLPGTAQAIVGATAVTAITGEVSSTIDADMYLLYVPVPAAFSATTVGPGTNFDTRLFLFDALGFGVYSQDDVPATGGKSTLPPAHANGPTTAGLYYVAVSGYHYDAVSGGGLIFTGPWNEANGPVGPGGAEAITGWNDAGGSYQPIGVYEIQLTGAYASDIPEPGTSILVFCGGLMIAALRFRKRNRGLG